MMELPDVLSMAARAARLATDYLIENLGVEDLQAVKPEQERALIVGMLGVAAYVQSWLKQHLPHENVEMTRVVDIVSSQIAARIKAAESADQAKVQPQ